MFLDVLSFIKTASGLLIRYPYYSTIKLFYGYVQAHNTWLSFEFVSLTVFPFWFY